MKKKLTYRVIKEYGIEPGYTFCGVKVYQRMPDTRFYFDCVLGEDIYFVRVPTAFAQNMHEEQTLNVVFLGYTGKRKVQFGYLSDKDEIETMPTSDVSELMDLGIMPGHVFTESSVLVNTVKDVNGWTVRVSYVELTYQAKTLRYSISGQRVYPWDNLQNVSIVFCGYNKCGNPLFEFETVHMEGSVKRISTNYVEITEVNGNRFTRVYSKACKLFRGLMNANVNIDLPLNVNPCHVSLNKVELKSRCAYYLSEEGESFRCQIIGKTDKLYYVLCNGTLGYIEQSMVGNDELKVGYSCICKLLECDEKTYILPFEFEKYE